MEEDKYNSEILDLHDQLWDGLSPPRSSQPPSRLSTPVHKPMFELNSLPEKQDKVVLQRSEATLEENEGSSGVGVGVEFKEIYEEKGKSFKCDNIVFTCFDEEAISNPEEWCEIFQKKIDGWVLAQLEKCPKTGRLHLQGMAHAGQSGCRWGMLKGTKTWKAKCRDISKSIEYCTKSKTQVRGPFEYGKRPLFSASVRAQKGNEAKRILHAHIKKIGAIEACDQGLISPKEVLATKAYVTMSKANERIKEQTEWCLKNGVNCDWISGETGTGKTRTVYEYFGAEAYRKMKNKWWENYEGQDIVWIDEIDHDHASWIGTFLKEWTDRVPFHNECKHGSLTLRPKKFIVTSNNTIDELWPEEKYQKSMVGPLKRRFKEYEFPKDIEKWRKDNAR